MSAVYGAISIPTNITIIDQLLLSFFVTTNSRHKRFYNLEPFQGRKTLRIITNDMHQPDVFLLSMFVYLKCAVSKFLHVYIFSNYFRNALYRES